MHDNKVTNNQQATLSSYSKTYSHLPDQFFVISVNIAFEVYTDV